MVSATRYETRVPVVTYSQSVLECQASDGQGLEEFRNGLSTSLGITSCACWWALSRREVGDALRGLGGDVWPSHGVDDRF